MSGTFAELADLYQSVVLDRSRHPRHQRRMEPFDAAAKGDNPMCGDRVEVRLRLDGDALAETAFEARGCAIVVASADLMAEAVTGRPATDVAGLAEQFRAMVRTGTCPECEAAMEALKPLSGVHDYPSRLRCATLPWDALQSALKEARYG